MMKLATNIQYRVVINFKHPSYRWLYSDKNWMPVIN